MRFKHVLIICGAVLFSMLTGVFIGQSQQKAKAQTVSKSDCDLFAILDREKISVARRLGDDGEFYAILRRREEPPENDSYFRTSDKLSVYKEGKEVFSKVDFVIDNFYFLYSTTKPSPQLVVETNGGGTDNFLEIYVFRNGKFEEIIDSDETQMRGGYFVIPEYRTGMQSPYFKPTQIIVIQQIGGADDNPSATVFRYKNGRYKSVGEFKMKDLGDFIERQISKKNSQ